MATNDDGSSDINSGDDEHAAAQETEKGRSLRQSMIEEPTSCTSGLVVMSWFRGSLLEINHVMSVHGVCQVESSTACVFELAFVFIVWVKSVVCATSTWSPGSVGARCFLILCVVFC